MKYTLYKLLANHSIKYYRLCDHIYISLVQSLKVNGIPLSFPRTQPQVTIQSVFPEYMIYSLFYLLSNHSVKYYHLFII